MIWLITACLLWAPSFGLVPILIRDYGMDPFTLSVLRMFYALILFFPLLRPKKYKRSKRWALVVLGGIQFGVMYVTLFYSYKYLKGYEVGLLTIFTPLYVSILHQLIGKEAFRFRPFLCVGLAVAGAFVIKYSDPGTDASKFWIGFAILQVCNLSFAIGQVMYRRIMKSTLRFQDSHVFGWMYMGALAVTLISWGFLSDHREQLSVIQSLPLKGWIIVLWLGLIPSGLAFFLFNHGALQVDAHSMAIANNLKIPFMLLVTLLPYPFNQGEGIDWLRFFIGTALMIGALWWNHRPVRMR
jgi:drug/metabolite transporter (DMT)-like permease